MKKTFTINLAGSVFHIDEDAYTLLDNYLRSLREYFNAECGGNEIVSDIELRISELFTEYRNTGVEVISIMQVEEVINRMGSPEEMDAIPEENSYSHSKSDGEESKKNRRFFRDPQDKILGGVLSGIAAYFDWNTTAIRVIFIVLTVCGLFWGTIFAYFILWFIIPEARTTAEKLSMKGENITIENIGKSVTKGFEQMNQYIQSERTQSQFQQMGQKTVHFMGTLVKITFICGCVILIPVLVSILLASIGFIITTAMALGGKTMEVIGLFPYFDWYIVNKSPLLFIGGGIVILFLSGLPLVILIHSIMRYLGKTEPFSMGTKIILFVLWVLAWIALGLLISHAVALDNAGIL